MPIGLCVGLPMRKREDNANACPTQPEWALSMISQIYPMNVNVMFSALCGKETGEARNDIVRHALKMKAKYIWFVDDDTAPPKEAARHLMFVLEQADEDVMVGGGIYCAKTHPTEPVVYRGNGQGAFWKWRVGEVFECTGLGTGCMMIKTEVFKHLEEPWFKTVQEFPEEMQLSDGTPVQSIQQTDDLYFCDKVIAAGFRIVADGAIQCIHWDVKTGTPYMLPEDSYPVRNAITAKTNAQVA